MCLSQSDERTEKLLKFMREEIRSTKLPWVSWSKLLKNTNLILGETRMPIAGLWNVLEPITFTLAPKEKKPKAKNPRVYEYKMGHAWVYIPAKMIELYAESKEL